MRKIIASVALAVALGATVVLAPSATAAADTAAPQLASLTATPTRVDVSQTAKTVTFTAHVTDDASGLATGYYPSVHLNSASGAAIYTGTPTLTSGTATDGIYRLTAQIPRTAEPGDWPVTVFLKDIAGNHTWVEGSALLDRGTVDHITVSNCVPDAPAGVTATPGDWSAQVSWTAPAANSSPITGYTITRSPGSITKTVPGDATTANIVGLTTGVKYSFKVVATNSYGNSASASSNTITPSGRPNAPMYPTAIAGNRSAKVWWMPNLNNGNPITSYTFKSRSGGGFIQTVPVSETFAHWQDGQMFAAATLTGLTNGTSYSFTMFATNSAGDSKESPWTNAVTPNGPPAAPTDVLATGDNGAARVSWTAPADGTAVTAYTVTSSPGGITATVYGPRDNSGSASDAPTTATVRGLTNGTSYSFTVVARNDLGNSPASSASNSVTPAGVPTAPTAVVATRGNESAQVSWGAGHANGSPATGYTITSSPGGLTTSVDGDTTSTVIPGLTNGVSYRFAVVATNALGNSPAATSSWITPSGVPAQPTVVSATRGIRSATVSWTAADENGSPVTSYTVISSPAGITQTVDAGTTSTVIAGLTNGTAYTFIVVATNDLGDSTASPPSNIVTPAGAPSAPRIAAAKSGSAGGKLTGIATWNQPSTNGGQAITAYRITAYRYRANGTIASTTRSPMLSPARRSYSMPLAKGNYRFTSTAYNAAGTSPASGRSKLITAR